MQRYASRIGKGYYHAHFVIVVTQIGGDLGIVSAATSAAFVTAALLSVLIFLLAMLTILRRDEPAAGMLVHPLCSAG